MEEDQQRAMEQGGTAQPPGDHSAVSPATVSSSPFALNGRLRMPGPVVPCFQRLCDAWSLHRSTDAEIQRQQFEAIARQFALCDREHQNYIVGTYRVYNPHHHVPGCAGVSKPVACTVPTCPVRGQVVDPSQTWFNDECQQGAYGIIISHLDNMVEDLQKFDRRPVELTNSRHQVDNPHDRGPGHIVVCDCPAQPGACTVSYCAARGLN